MTTSTPAGGLRILIVEDEVLVAMFLSDVLMDLGHTITGTVESVEQALKLGAEQPTDLAFVDVGLAGKGDGVEAARMLREQHGIQSVLMSGASEATLSARAEKVQPLGILIKPYTESDVVRVLDTAVAQLRKPNA
jgi:CheY-like chemotaxis protein